MAKEFWEDDAPAETSVPAESGGDFVNSGMRTHDGLPARKNGDGSYSTEVSVTVTNPRLNGGKPTNIPSLWGGVELDEDAAVDAAIKSGRSFQAFDSIPSAVSSARERSNAGGAGADSAFWLSDKPAAQQDLPAGVTPSTAGAGRGNAGLADYRAKEAAQTAVPERAAWEDNADQLMADTAAPAAKKVSVLEGVQLQPEKPWSFREASETRRAIDDMPVRRGESIATPVPTAAGIGMDIRDSIKNPAARGVVAGFTGLGQVLPGAVEAAADFVGADGIADVAARTARTGRQIAAPLQPKAGNEKLVFDIANSITQTAPTLIMGLGGGPAMTGLFAQSAAQEYSEGRAAGLDGARSAARAGVMAGAEVLGERFGFGEQIKILKGLTARIPAEELAPVFARQIMKEIPGEQLTTLIQFLGDKAGPGALNPEAALSDYLQQAGDTLKVTIGQTAVMGGGPVAISAVRKQFASPVDRTPQIEALRKTGDETAAALLERRQNTEMAAFTTERETEALTDFGPDLQQRYRDTRLAGAKTGDAVVQTAARWNFEQAAQLAGLSPKAQEAIANKLAEVPAEKVPGFIQKAVTGLVNAGQAQPFDGMETLAQTIETQRDAMLDSVLSTMADIESLEQQDEPQETASAAVDPAVAEAPGLGSAGVAGINEQGAVPALSDINDVIVTPELDAVHAAATSPLNDLPEPTQAQKDAGNYKVGRIRMSGLDISIENPQGSVRRGTDEDGKAWESPLKDHYGYFKGTTAADGDKLDVFIKPGTPQDYAGPVFVVDQVDPKTGKFDEHKVVFGAADQAEAESIYRRNYSADWQGLANITALPMPAFKAWAASKATRKPLGAITEQIEGSQNMPQGPMLPTTVNANEINSFPSERIDLPTMGARPQNVQNAPQRPTGTEAQAAPVETPASAGVDAAAAAGVPNTGSAAAVAPVGLKIGITPKDAEPVTVKNGKVYIGKNEAVNFESGDPVTVLDGATDAQIKQALKDAGALSRRQKVFGGSDRSQGRKEGAMLTFEDGRQDTTQPMFSRSADPLAILSETDDLYSMPKSDKDTIEGITADHDSEIKIRKTDLPGNETMYTLTMPDGTPARITVRKSGPGSVYGAETDADNNTAWDTGRPGENPEDVPDDMEDVWIDVSNLKPGQNGARVYNIAATYAHNTGRMFIGDPAGLSDAAMRRRAEHMLSNALKFGTTRHLAPHPRQTDGATGLGIPALKWVYGDDVGNIQRLVELNVKALDSAYPEAAQLTYDPESGTFSADDKKRLDPAGVKDLFSGGPIADRRGAGRRAAFAGAGWRTIARGAVFRSLLRGRGTGGDGAGRSGAGESLLDQLVRQRAQLASASKDGRIFYSRPLTAELFRQMTTPMQRGMKTADLQKAIAPVLKRWENGPNITVVATTKDLPMKAPSDVHGVYFGGKVYLVAQNIRDKAKAMEVLTHEAIAHHGLREMLGDDWKKFMANIQLALKTGNKPLAAIRKDVRAAYVDDAGKFNLSEMQEADEIAAKVVEQAVDADGNFRPGFWFVKSVYAKVVEFLRSIGIDVKMTMAELQGALVNAQRFLEAGNRTAGAKKTAKPVFARAYHGTPHRFERFTTDAIGTGEGAQAYGWGLYFASKKEIAEHYRKGLSYKQIVKEFRDEMPDDADFDEALDAADTMSPQRARVIRALAADDWLGFDYPAQAITAAFKELDAYDASQELQDAVKGAQGQLYEVEIPEDSEILLWDKPLSEQPKKVLDALKQLAVDGSDYYPTLSGMMQPMEAGNTTGRAVYMAMQRESGSDKNASRELRSVGIRGIKYLDGTSRDKGDGSFNYVVFNGDDVSIVEAAYSRTAKAPASIEAEKAAGAAKPAQAEMFQPGFWDAPQETRLDNIIYELQDGRIDLKRVQEAITKAGTIPEKFDARLQETLYPGRVATRAKQFLDDEAKPLLDAMARNNVTMSELADYLHARHAEERNKQIAKVNPDLPDGGAGKNSKGVLMTTEAAKQHIAALSEGKRMVLSAMAKRVDAITQGTTKLLVDEGLEKQETIDAWTGAYKSYVPLFRDEAENGNPHPTGSGMSVRGGSSKRAVGSTKQATNILAHVLMQREAAITRAEKNRVAVALYGLALTNPNPDFWTTIKPGMSPEAIGRELQRMGVDPTVAEAGMMGVPTIKTVDPTLGRVVSRPNPMYKSLPGAIVLKVNGEDRVLMVNVNDPRGLRMAENLKNMDGLTKFDIAGSIVGKTTRWLASVNTQYNPAFGLVNLTRDTLGGAINLSSTKLRGKTLKVLAMTPGALKGIGLELSGKNSGEWGRLFRQFQQDGGQTGYREMFKDANDRAKALEAELKAMEKAGKLTTDKVAGKVLGALDIFNTTLENAVRLAAYREALQEGMSRPEAARLGRELTVDFNRKGRMGRELGPLYAFFNASVQGSARTLQTLAGPDGAKIIAGGVSLGVLQAVMLLAAGYDDDEIPEFVKSRALIIPLGTDDEGKKRYFTIPLPLGLHVLPNTGRVLAELTMDGGKDALTKGFEAVGEIAGAFNPLGGGSMIKFDQNGQIEVVNSVLKNLSPTVTDWALEMTWNQNFAGTAIEREGYGNDPRPGFERAREGTLRAPTGQAYLEISRILNKVSGGTEYEAGRVSPTPEMVRYLAQVVGGGLLREIEKTVNTSIAMSKGEDAKPTGLPVFGRFYGEVDDASVQRSRYYDNLTAIEKAEKLIRAAEKKGDLDAADRIESDKPEAMLKKEKNRAVKDLRELNKEAMETVGDSEAIKALDEERTEVMRDLNEAAAEIDAPRRDATLGAKLRKSLAAAP